MKLQKFFMEKASLKAEKSAKETFEGKGGVGSRSSRNKNKIK